MISSTANPRVKQVALLREKRAARLQEGMFIAEGATLCGDLIAAGMTARFAMLADAPPAHEFGRAHPRLECIVVTGAVMRAMSDETTPPGVLCAFSLPDPDAALRQLGPSTALLLILDSVRDPGNLGACLRVAAGAGCSAVLLAPGCVDAWNPKVLRGGMGAHARLPVVPLAWREIQAACAGRAIYAADAAGGIVYSEADWRGPSALILGGETKGVSAEARGLAAATVRIPLALGVESLNAAVACGILLFEAARQRGLPRR